MWFFRSPEIVFGQDALGWLAELDGQRAFIVTDENIVSLGLLDLVTPYLEQAGIAYRVFDQVEPDPSIQTVERGAQQMRDYGPDWVIGLGGGSCMDAAKGMWVLYERPDIDARGISPLEEYGLRQKARLVAIPTTSGTGAESTWGIVLTDTENQVKLSLGSPENTPDLAIVDPALVMGLPPRLTAETGMDALTHAIEGYTCSWRNDFSEGLCLKAIELIMTYLPRVMTNGADVEAREKMHNAASIAGLGFINAMSCMAHALGHSLGAVFHVPHGRAVGLFLPYTIEYIAREDPSRYAQIARFLGLPGGDDAALAQALVQAVRDLSAQIGVPTSIHDLDISEPDLEAQLPKLVENAEGDTSLLTSPRMPDTQDVRRLYRYAHAGQPVDF
ncbi:MAG: iron-containing alcohol dehydrogenase [Chloroflexi bacterium]|nr:iron-containing alcohol dehydrogenase [Chloroflexota bacterium]MBU1751198.1 iron-containing alcohol dehydrogenase [Chloroflexota bacterium]MBU1878617.1 iron-containing alcohol dehydrogenase [Chloroflexota bacterium]